MRTFLLPVAKFQMTDAQRLRQLDRSVDQRALRASILSRRSAIDAKRQ